MTSVSVLALWTMSPPASALQLATARGGSSASAAASAASAALASVQQAQTATQQSMSHLLRATQAVQSLQQAQTAARALAQQTTSSLPSGLVPGGLVAAFGAGGASNPDLAVWQGASAPTQTSSNGQTLVTVQQTQQKAILTWTSFNVSPTTTVYFNQSAGTQSDGNNDWIALNRIIDPSGLPSQILGQIKAEGSVYLIDANGIVFGGTSQVDVHTLVASSLGFLGENIAGLTPGSSAYDAAVSATNAMYLNATGGGIAAPEATGATGTGGAGNLVLGLGTSASSIPSAGAITIAPGASITTAANGAQSDGGFVLIAAPSLDNEGTISTPDGQAILAAGIGVSLLQPNSSQSSQLLIPELTGRVIAAGGQDVTPVGTLVTNGLIQATTGNVTLLGTNVSVGGTVEVTTSVSTPGSITISTVDEAETNDTAATVTDVPVDRRAGQLDISGTIANLPEDDGTTVPSDSTTFAPGTLSLTAGSIWLENGSLIEAPGASVTLSAFAPSSATVAQPPGDTAVQGRIYIDDGATIDVAGLADVELPVSDTLVTIGPLTADDLADSPLQRNSFLLGQTIVIDSTIAGVSADGEAWVGTPLIDAEGYVEDIPRTVDQLLTNAGSITLSGGQVMTASGSSLNLDGGYIHYLGGMIATTRLIDASGNEINIADADPDDTYVGIAGAYSFDHVHWGITDYYTAPLLVGASYEPDYIQGGNAGTLNVFGSQAVVLDGAMTAEAFAGLKQEEAGVAPSGTAATPIEAYLPAGGTFDLGADSSLAFPTGINGDNGQTGSVIVQNQAPSLSDLAPGFGADTPLNTTALDVLGTSNPDNILAWTTVPAAALSNGGFQNVTVTMNSGTNGSGSVIVAQGTVLSVRPGGSITIDAANAVTILGDLIAPAGDITVATGSETELNGGGNITVGPDAILSAAGEWVNDSTDPNAVGATNFINAGSVSLTALYNSTLLLSPGSLIDVASGGAMLYGGQLAASSNGVPLGRGGSVSLETGGYFNVTVAIPYTGGPVEMDGTIDSFGFSGGGTLTLRAPAIQIGGAPTTMGADDLYLPTDFFETQGFGSYVLNAFYTTTVAPGATVRLTQQNLIPNVAALAQLATGGDVTAAGLTSLGTLDPYDRQATNLVMTAGGDLFGSSAALTPAQTSQYAVTLGAGASIVADAGASIGLGSPAQVMVLGSIIAPGGSITLSGDDTNAYGFSQTGQIVSGTNTALAANQSVWLGADALLDVAGIALTDPSSTPVRGLATLPTTGEVLAGGSVVLSDGTGYVVAQTGSVIDVSGTSAVFDEAQAASGLEGTTAAPQQVWSNAGSITLAAAEGLYFNATLKAQGGAPDAEGGTLTILPDVVANASATQPSAKAIIFTAANNAPPAGLTPDSAPATSPSGNLVFSTSELNGSGIGTLVVGGALTSSGSEQPLVPVAFAGNVDLSLGRAIEINTPEIAAISTNDLGAILNGTATLSSVLTSGAQNIGAPVVSISAPYVAIAGAGGVTGLQTLTPTADLANATLNVNAQFIDLENQFELAGFAQANFVSSGDIRLSSTITAGVIVNTFFPGELYTPGNLTFAAADLYPASGETFILDASGLQPTTITFETNGTSSVPLSAGGTLLVDATNIIQAGTIRAPSGTIVLGVGDATDSATETEFASLPLTDTQSVTLAAGSTTSVSLDGSLVPYGTTTDGVDWQYDEVAGDTTDPDLTAPPPKVITINGSNVSLASGATIDLSGGGDLYATEWVAGTGGSRNVLSQYNLTYPASGEAVATPLYPNARNVYAIVPSYEAPVAAYDPVYDQTVQPATNPDGTATTQTETIGVGAAALGGQIGQAVYLSGVPGLAAGTYVLMPAQYATLPGAYRVVENTGAANVAPGQSVTLPDGTHLVSGYYVDALSGARSATPVQFELQSAAVWGQYSQYTLTSANSYFASQAAGNGTAVPPLPMDAGALTLAATSSLILDTTLDAAAAPGGLAAQVNIASQDIEIVGQGEQALSGYLQLSADSLDALGAGSLLIGGTRTSTADGVSIDAIANSVVVANDANDPLTGPEILLVTQTNPSGTDPNAKNGLLVESGSVIEAEGTLPASAAEPITIGSATVSGDGVLLRVSNAGQVDISRDDLPTNAIGALTVQAGATIDGGAALTLDASGNLDFAPTANFSATNIAVDAPTITLTNATGAALAGLSGFVVGPQNLGQFASASQVDLRSYGAIIFDGTVNLTFGQSVELSAGTFEANGGSVTISAPTVAFTNDLGATAATATTGSASLNVSANEIDLGAGTKTLSGFDQVAFTATGGIVGQGTGSFDMGSANVTLAAPVYLADTSSQTSLTTTGALVLNANAGTALALAPVGGAIAFTGGSLAVNGAILSAPAGDVSLEATTGDLDIASGSLVSSQGVGELFFDVMEYAPAGTITLTADTGSINVAAGATLDFAGATNGGAAGTLTLSAPLGTVNLNGTILGAAATGYEGGSFALTTGGAVDLDNLADELAQSGVTESISVDANTGNLVLSVGNTLTAHVVELTADGGTGDLTNTSTGNVVIDGTINASGTEGGDIELYGKDNVNIEGALIARACLVGNACNENLDQTVAAHMIDPLQQGGTVNIGTTATFDTATGTYNATYGYENMVTSGGITLGATSLIDVTGGTAGGLSGGTVSFRAPLLEDGTVNVNVKFGTQIVGSRATTLQAYAVWSTTDTTTGAQHFDGIVDPAGWYTSTGTLEAGTFTEQGSSATTFTFTPDADGGGTVTNTATNVTTDLTQQQVDDGDSTIGFGGLENDYFTPTSVNTDHSAFYGYESDGTTPGTLMGFVENFPIAASVQAAFVNAGIQNFAIAPGIELDNPSAAVNDGNISIVTNWNLGAETTNANGQTILAYRYDGEAPFITFKAENDVKVDASLTDGFFQIEDPTQPAPASTNFYIANPGQDTFQDVYFKLNYNQYWYYSASNYGAKYGGRYSVGGQFANVIAQPATVASFGADPDTMELGQYYALYEQYLDIFLGHITGNPAYLYTSSDPAARNLLLDGDLGHAADAPVAGQPLFSAQAPTAQQEQAQPDAYLIYMDEYEIYANQMSTWLAGTTNGSYNNGSPYQAVILQPPPQVLTTAIPSGTVTIVTSAPTPLDNTPSPVATATNPLPLATQTLENITSSTFQLVAGANFASANPLAVEAATLLSPGDGNVIIDGHISYVDTYNQTLYQPTMIRTGAGSIDIAAAGDLSLLDTTAPGAIYTAGTPAEGAPSQTAESIVQGNPTFGDNDLLATNVVDPDGAGNISIVAGGNINGVESVTGTGSALSQFWWQWMETGNVLGTNADGQPEVTQTSINFGAFDQGVMSVGGNVTISADGNITNLAVSLPTTWYMSGGAPVTVGGGNLTVNAGGNILSGDYFVANGTGTLTAGGLIGSSGLTYNGGEVSTLLAAQNGVFNVSARQGVDIGAMVNPSYIQSGTLTTGYDLPADAQSYSTSSALNVVSTTGDVSFNTLTNLALIGVNTGEYDDSFVLPSTLRLAAFSGGIAIDRGGELYPSAVGQLNLIAAQSINISGAIGDSFSADYFGMIDAPSTALPSPENPVPQVLAVDDFNGQLTSDVQVDHSETALHADDAEPVHIYSLTGSITDGTLNTDGDYSSLLQIAVDKPAEIEAGQDIFNLAFLGENLRDDDVTSIIAGRDILDSPDLAPGENIVMPALILGGPGTFLVQAGRNIGPLLNEQQVFDIEDGAGYTVPTLGIDAIGNADDPYLPHESANIQVLFGTGPGVDTSAFVNAYIDPDAIVPGVDTNAALIAFMEQYDEGTGIDTGLVSNNSVTLTLAQAWSQFQALPLRVQQLFAEDVLFDVLQSVGDDYNNPASAYYQQYARGYAAINTLFPAAYGYTANSLSGGLNGANSLVDTGNLDIRSTTIQTQQGGNVNILGPGGEALVGSESAPPVISNDGTVIVGPSDEGILTLESGNVDIFTDQSLLLAQSRVFTEEGGNMTIWSSNGDINAGKGAKTVSSVPTPIYVSDEDHYNTRDARGEVSGAGISTVPAIPDVPAGDVNLIAPRGTVDAGAGGIRVSGDLNIAALQVLNAFNIQVQGVTTGVPTVATPNVGSLSDASAASGAATKAITATGQGNNANGQPSILIVEIEGYGGDDSEPAQQPQQNDDKKHRQSDATPVYNPNSPIQILGVGSLTDEEKETLSANERGNL